MGDETPAIEHNQEDVVDKELLSFPEVHLKVTSVIDDFTGNADDAVAAEDAHASTIPGTPTDVTAVTASTEATAALPHDSVATTNVAAVAFAPSLHPPPQQLQQQPQQPQYPHHAVPSLPPGFTANPFLVPPHQPVALSAATGASGVPVAASLPIKTSTRQAHLFTDKHGNHKKFGSALGLLTARFVQMILASPSGALDMNDSALQLGVPKRRIYDITNVLEGVGIIEKRSKNTVAWKGSEAILGDAIDPEAKDQMESLRESIAAFQQEDMVLERWLIQFAKLTSSLTSMHYPQPIYSDDVVNAVLQQSSPSSSLFDEHTGKPQRSLIVVQAPGNSVAQIVASTEGPERQLFVGTREHAVKHEGNPQSNDQNDTSHTTSPNRKRKLELVYATGRPTARHFPENEEEKPDIMVIPMSCHSNQLQVHALQQVAPSLSDVATAAAVAAAAEEVVQEHLAAGQTVSHHGWHEGDNEQTHATATTPHHQDAATAGLLYVHPSSSATGTTTQHTTTTTTESV